MPADTFDNVKGKFPIGFLIWDLNQKNKTTSITVDVFNEEGNFMNNKSFYSFAKDEFISNWLRKFYDQKNKNIGYLILPGVDMQAQNGVYFTSIPTESDVKQHKLTKITINNCVQMCIYLTIRQCIHATWINDRDQFLYPNDGWQTDTEFQNDCLAYALFHSQNRITSSEGTNHWIPFTEQEVNAQAKFASSFMTDYMKGKIKQEPTATNLFETEAHNGVQGNTPLQFSAEATAVFDAGRALWKYYHAKKDVNVNASLYDIREYFQGRNDAGRMNSKSEDTTYMSLIGDLRSKLSVLADAIKPKVYEYGFLKE